MKKTLTLIASFAFLISCQQSVKSVTAEELSKQESASVQIVDLRTKKEFDFGHVPGAINVPTDKAEVVAYSIYKEMPVYLYGKGAEEIADKLMKGGFKSVNVLQGGFNSWTAAKYDTEKLVLYDNDTIPFLKAREGNKLVLVDFNAVWCGPCKRIEPFVKNARIKRADVVSVYSIDTDSFPDLAREYDARSIPLLVFIKNNKVLHKSVGLVSEQKINEMIDQYK